MSTRIAVTLALVAFALCLLAGAAVGNPFANVVVRALVAMAGTFVVGLVIGAMAQKMLDEHVAQQRAKLGISKVPQAQDGASGR